MDDYSHHTAPPHGAPRLKIEPDTMQNIKARVTELWPTGATVSEIGATLSVEFQLPISKNMVSGYAHRMKLTPRESPIQPKKSWTLKETRKKKFNPTPNVKMFWHPGSAPVKPEQIKTKRKPVANPIPMEALRANSCRWPEWENDEKPKHLYCGSPKATGFSYCPYHCSFAFSNLQPERIKDNGHASPEQAHGSNGSADSMVRQVASELPEDADTGGTLQARNGADTSPAGV